MTSAVGAAEKTWNDTYKDVTTSRPWRHTAGRISCLARIPIYLIGLGLQTAKIVVKAIFSPLVSLVAWASGTAKLDSWTFSGVGRDCLIWVRLLDKIGSSSIGVLCAPPKHYNSFYEAVKGTGKFVILGAHHRLLGAFNKHAPPCKYIAEIVFTHRAQYSQIIFQNKTICCDKTITAGLDSWTKAG